MAGHVPFPTLLVASCQPIGPLPPGRSVNREKTRTGKPATCGPRLVPPRRRQTRSAPAEVHSKHPRPCAVHGRTPLQPLRRSRLASHHPIPPRVLPPRALLCPFAGSSEAVPLVHGGPADTSLEAAIRATRGQGQQRKRGRAESGGDARDDEEEMQGEGAQDGRSEGAFVVARRSRSRSPPTWTYLTGCLPFFSTASSTLCLNGVVGPFSSSSRFTLFLLG